MFTSQIDNGYIISDVMAVPNLYASKEIVVLPKDYVSVDRANCTNKKIVLNAAYDTVYIDNKEFKCTPKNSSKYFLPSTVKESKVYSRSDIVLSDASDNLNGFYNKNGTTFYCKSGNKIAQYILGTPFDRKHILTRTEKDIGQAVNMFSINDNGIGFLTNGFYITMSKSFDVTTLDLENKKVISDMHTGLLKSHFMYIVKESNHGVIYQYNLQRYLENPTVSPMKTSSFNRTENILDISMSSSGNFLYVGYATGIDTYKLSEPYQLDTMTFLRTDTVLANTGISIIPDSNRIIYQYSADSVKEFVGRTSQDLNISDLGFHANSEIVKELPINLTIEVNRKIKNVEKVEVIGSVINLHYESSRCQTPYQVKVNIPKGISVQGVSVETQVAV